MSLTVGMSLLLLAAFIAGFGAGVVFVEVRTRGRHTDRMEPGNSGHLDDLQDAEPDPPRRGVSFRSVILVLIAVMLAVNIALGFLLIIARAATQQAAQDRTALVDCTTHYNKALSDALGERDDRASASTVANLAWLRNFRDQLEQPARKPSAARERFLGSLNGYITALEGVQAGRESNAYPPFDQCAELAHPSDAPSP